MKLWRRFALGLLALTFCLALTLSLSYGGDQHHGAKTYTKGLAAHYYRDIKFWGGHWPDHGKPDVDAADWTFTNYAYTRTEPLVNHFFVKRAWFSVRWQGYLDIPAGPRRWKKTAYRFHIWADDGCRLYLDGKLVIDSWRPAWEGGAEAHRYANVKLTPGKHKIVLEYFQGQSLEKHDRDPIKLYWKCRKRRVPGQIIPASRFYHKLEDLVPTPGRKD